MNEVQDGSDKLISIWVKSVFARAVLLFSAEFLQWTKQKHHLLFCLKIRDYHSEEQQVSQAWMDELSCGYISISVRMSPSCKR